MRSNREYDYFGNVLEYEYDYFPSYSSTSTSTQKVLILEYEYKYTSTITPSLICCSAMNKKYDRGKLSTKTNTTILNTIAVKQSEHTHCMSE